MALKAFKAEVRCTSAYFTLLSNYITWMLGFAVRAILCLSQPVLIRILRHVPRVGLVCLHTFLSRNPCASPDFTLSQELHASCRCTWFYSVARTSFIMSAIALHTSAMLDGFCHASTRPVVQPPSHAVVYLEAGCLIRVPVSSTSRKSSPCKQPLLHRALPVPSGPLRSRKRR